VWEAAGRGRLARGAGSRAPDGTACTGRRRGGLAGGAGRQQAGGAGSRAGRQVAGRRESAWPPDRP